MVSKVDKKLGYPSAVSVEDLSEFMHRELIPLVEKIRQTQGLNMNRFSSGIGSPEGVVLADNAAIYLNETGGAGTRVYLKTTNGVNTGWTAVL